MNHEVLKVGHVILFLVLLVAFELDVHCRLNRVGAFGESQVLTGEIFINEVK
jgi:hypothetical protein